MGPGGAWELPKAGEGEGKFPVGVIAGRALTGRMLFESEEAVGPPRAECTWKTTRHAVGGMSPWQPEVISKYIHYRHNTTTTYVCIYIHIYIYT